MAANSKVEHSKLHVGVCCNVCLIAQCYLKRFVYATTRLMRYCPGSRPEL